MSDTALPFEPARQASGIDLESGSIDGGSDARRSTPLGRIAAVVGAVLRQTDSVVEHEQDLQVAQAICSVLAEPDAAGGLTRGAIYHRLSGRFPEKFVGRRLDLLFYHGTVQHPIGRPNENRYVLNRKGLLGSVLLPLLAEEDGVTQLLYLLDRTRERAAAPDARREDVAEDLATVRRLLTAFANEISLLVDTATLPELLAETRGASAEQLLERVGALNTTVTQRFPDLDPAAYAVVEETNRYLKAIRRLIGRVVRKGGEQREFRVLPVEEYLTAARRRPVEELAAVLADVVFDPPRVHVDAAAVAEALASRGPPPRSPRRPPAPLDTEVQDPMGELEAQQAAAAEQRVAIAEQLLKGRDECDLTGELLNRPWPGPVVLLAELWALDADPAQPYSLRYRDSLIVSPTGPVSYVSPVTLVADRSEATRRVAAAVDADHSTVSGTAQRGMP